MWARIVEIILGFWLVASPFIFPIAASDRASFINYLLCSAAVIGFGLLSFWDRTKWTHFLTLLVALWLIGFGYSAGYPSPPTAQNQIVVGVLLGMFAIIPNRTNEMPAAWRKFYEEKNYDKRTEQNS